MNSFCLSLSEALQSKFDIDVKVFVTKKEKIVHLSLRKPLIQYPFYKQIITFIRKYWYDREYFCEPYVLKYPKLNQSIKWHFDYVIALKKDKTVKKIEKWMLYWTCFSKI